MAGVLAGRPDSADASLPFREPPSSLTDEYLGQRLALTQFIADLGPTYGT